MSNALIPVTDIERMAVAVAKSGLFGIKSPEQGVALMLIAQAEGLHPAIAARDYHIIQGRPALKADAMMARFQQAGGKVEWKVYTDAEVTGVFSHPQGGSLTLSWTMDQAKRIGLSGKENWRNYPRAMLRSRCISEGIRSVYPGCVCGIYSSEEVQDFTDAPSPPTVKDMGTVVEVTQEEDGAFALFLPGGEDAYASYTDLEAWQTGFLELAIKIFKSSKLSDEIKTTKMADLRQANWEVIEQMKGLKYANFRAELAKLGASLDPKSPPPAEEDEVPSLIES